MISGEDSEKFNCMKNIVNILETQNHFYYGNHILLIGDKLIVVYLQITPFWRGMPDHS